MNYIKTLLELYQLKKQTRMKVKQMQESVSCKPYKGCYHVVHSSGSTGTPGYFVYDDGAWNTMLLGIIRAARWRIIRY